MAGLAATVAALSLGLGLARTPYVGVACHQPNSTACGRVGIAVWVARRALRIDTTLDGAHVRLTPPKSRAGFWVGFVVLPRQRLKLPPSWAGSPPRRLLLGLRIRYPDGWRSGTVRVLLSPGWG